ncbi:hypothetical protein BTZ20_2528 [Rhodococcus sp. MTM3W5.2]|uniref:DUF3099 domain-containing protein n=1 Tax=Rhodococcus sp. MTM3W5.2 TaxID=1805827 RepID=UPI000979603F|nr:DUF3099 domain-containing protein [Rhodococcus sp. MTM3W5.2]AQA22897.1 hypothetical protein BTZ20_2528 [Rhodococcus sp. MTM3W5.2]
MASSSDFDRAKGNDDASGNPVLITDAAQSFYDEQRVRVRKYTILMAIRIPALVLAALAYSEWANPWISLAIIGISVPLPWIAVLVANDRPPRKADEPRRYDRQAPTPPAIESQQHPTIEG